MISQNNSIVISVCNLACAARFRANAGAKSVGMVDLMPTPPAAETTLAGPSQFPTEREIWQHLLLAEAQNGRRSAANPSLCGAMSESKETPRKLVISLGISQLVVKAAHRRTAAAALPHQPTS